MTDTEDKQIPFAEKLEVNDEHKSTIVPLHRENRAKDGYRSTIASSLSVTHGAVVS